MQPKFAKGYVAKQGIVLWGSCAACDKGKGDSELMQSRA